MLQEYSSDSAFFFFPPGWPIIEKREKGMQLYFSTPSVSVKPFSEHFIHFSEEKKKKISFSAQTLR